MRRSIRALVASLVLVCLVTGTTALAVLLDRSLERSMRELKAGTVSALESFLGRSISYTSISPSILRFIEIRDLAIHDDADPEDVLLTIRKVRISYSLWTLLVRRNAEAALREIHIDNSQLDIDFDRDKKIISILNGLLSGKGGGEGLGIRISGANVSLKIRIHGVDVSLTNIFFTVDNVTDALAVTVRGGAAGSISNDFFFDSTLKVQGRVGKLLDWSDLTVNVLSFSSSVLQVGRQTYQVVWKDDNVEVRKIWDHSPIDVQMIVDLTKNRFRINFRSQSFQPDSLFSFSGWASRYNQWLRAPITASGYVAYQAGGALDYDVDLDAYLIDQLPVHDVRLSGRFHGSEKDVAFESLSLKSASAGDADFSGDVVLGSFMPQGLLTLTDLRVLGTAPINGRVSLERTGGKLSIRGKELSIGDIPLEPLEFELSPDKEQENFTLTTAFSGDPHPHQIRIDGSLSLGRQPDLSVSATLTRVPVNRLIMLMMESGKLSDAEKAAIEAFSQFGITTRASLRTDFSSYSLSAPLVLSTWDDPKTSLQCSLSLNEKSLSISGFTGSWGSNTLHGDFSGDFTHDGGMRFTSGLTFRGTPYLVSGNYSPQLGLAIQGSYGLTVSVIPNTAHEYAFRATADKIPIPLGEDVRKISVELDGKLTPDSWWVSCPSLTFYDLPIPLSQSNTLELSAVLLPGKLTITRTRFADEVSVLVGSGSASYSFTPGSIDESLLDTLKAELSFQMKGGSEAYTVQGTAKNGALDVRTTFKGVPLKRVGVGTGTGGGAPVLVGQLSGNVRLTGPMDSLTVDVSAGLENGLLGTNPLSANASAEISGGKLEVKNLSLGYLTHTISGTTGAIDLGKGGYSLVTHYRGELFQDSLKSDIRLEGNWKATDPGSASGILGSAIQGHLTISNITVNGYQFPQWDMGVHSDAGTLFVDGGPESSVHLSLTSQMAFTIDLRRPNPVVLKAQGRITGEKIASTVDVGELDMRILNPILKSRVVTFTSGTGSGRLEVAGALNDPDFNGSLQLIGGGLTCVYAGDEAGPVSTILMFKGKTFTFPMVFSSAGPARMSATGSFTIDHWIPRSFILSIRTEGDTMARAKAAFGAVRIDGLASADFLISGTEERTDVKGSLTVSDCRITLGKYVATGDFVPEDTPTFVALQVTTGKRVEFNWPSIEFPVIRTTAKTGNTVNITYRGDTGAYTVKGVVDAQGGEVYYFDRSFIMKSGKLVLDEDQNSFDPRITARAEIRERDPKDNEEVKIYLIADNKLSMFSPSFTSEPSRSNAEILSMIGAPIVSRAETQGIGVSAVMLGSDIPIQFGLLRPFEQKVREMLGLDSFSLRTQVIQNLIASKLFGMETNPLDNTSLSLGKYLGNDLFVEMLIRMQAQSNFVGVPGTIAGLRADLEVNLEWATPFFILDWTFTPKTPQSLFIPDNAISLNWRISY